MAPADEECESKLPSFWALVATDLFSRDYGWFSPAVMCMVGLEKCPVDILKRLREFSDPCMR